MNRATSRALILAVAVAVSACGGGEKAARSPSQEQPGQYGVSFIVTVSRPTGGAITSQDGRINCGTANTGRDLCAPVSFPWATKVTLTAAADAGMYFQSWAADCGPSLAATCVLDTVSNGADKTVLAFFNPPERLGHGNVVSPSVHAPLYFKFLASDPSAPRCTNCHGASYGGVGIAPSCNACHAAAGWASWQQSCSFCHGQKNAVTKAGYDFALHPEWAAPPDDVQGRLTGTNGAAAGAHQRHLTGSTLRGPLPCSECHVVPETAIHPLNNSLDLPFGPIATGGGTLTPVWTASTLTCASTWCHGSFRNGAGANPVQWTGGAAACGSCHGVPPAGTHPGVSATTACSGCHPGYTRTSVNLATHVNGVIDAAGGACDSCHGFPPATGAHLTHFGLTSDQGTSGYGDLRVLEDFFASATPTSAPAKYAFGCGNCHPVDQGQHGMNDGSTVAKVVLDDGSGTEGLKALNAPSASYDTTAKTCSGVYCHSTGQAAPTYVTTPAWTSSDKLDCGACHGNPPRYASGGAGTATANSHLGVDGYAWVVGHFSGVGAVGHADRHGTANSEAVISCQTCHYDTTDPAPGFYWLNTTGSYAFAGTDPGQGDVSCTQCHATGGLAAPGADGVLPLRHVNGSRDVVFDARTAIDPTLSYLPAAPNKPTRPYWRSADSTTYWLGVVKDGTTLAMTLDGSTYDPATKTCTVNCHNMTPSPTLKTVWGAPFEWDCRYCHGDKYNSYYGY